MLPWPLKAMPRSPNLQSDSWAGLHNSGVSFCGSRWVGPGLHDPKVSERLSPPSLAQGPRGSQGTTVSVPRTEACICEANWILTAQKDISVTAKCFLLCNTYRNTYHNCIWHCPSPGQDVAPCHTGLWSRPA